MHITDYFEDLEEKNPYGKVLIMGKTKDFRLFVSNDIYDIGCNGQTIYIYQNGVEVKRFKDLIYVNHICLSPNQNVLAVKSCEGLLAFYSLSELKLIKKFKFSKLGAPQDGNCIFISDGVFVNIECVDKNELTSSISFYSPLNYQLIKRIPDSFENVLYVWIEYDGDSIYLLGYDSDADFIDKPHHGYFVAKLECDYKMDKCTISKDEYNFYIDKFIREIHPQHTLSKLYRYYKNNK